MRFFVFFIWILAYCLPLLPIGLLINQWVPLSGLPDEILSLTIFPVSFYMLLHSFKNRQGFNFIPATFLIGFLPTIVLLSIVLQHSLIKYAYSFIMLSCALVLLIWWKYPVRKSRFF